MKMHARRKARIGVLEAIYAEIQIHEDPEKILEDIFLRHEFSNGHKKFIRTLFFETLDKAAVCDELIEKHLENWEFNRIALLDKLILRIAITEMLYLEDVPPKVAMSEAIEIAKQYSTKDSSSFVNGILDSVYQENKSKIE